MARTDSGASDEECGGGKRRGGGGGWWRRRELKEKRLARRLAVFLFPSILSFFFLLVLSHIALPRARARSREFQSTLSLARSLSLRVVRLEKKKGFRARAGVGAKEAKTAGRFFFFSTPSISASPIFPLPFSLSTRLTKRLVLRKGRDGSERERGDSDLQEGRHGGGG